MSCIPPSQEDSDFSNADLWDTPRSMFLRELDAVEDTARASYSSSAVAHLEPGWKIPVLAHEMLQTNFPAVDLIRGHCDENLKCILAQTRCNVSLRGLRSGTLESTGGEFSEPLFLWLPDMPSLAADTEEKRYDRALEMVRDLLRSVYRKFIKWNEVNSLFEENHFEGWKAPDGNATTVHNVYLERPVGLMAQGKLKPSIVELAIQSLSGQLVKSRVSCAARTSVLNTIISKSFGVPAAHQRILHGAVILNNTSLPVYEYGILPPKATLSFISVPTQGTKIPLQVERLHPGFPFAATMRGSDNRYFQHLKDEYGFSIHLVDSRRTKSHQQEAGPRQAMFLWIPERLAASRNAHYQSRKEQCLLAVEDLTETVYEDHERWAADRNLPHPHDLQPLAPEHDVFLQPPPMSCSPANQFARLVYRGHAKFFERCSSKWQRRSSPYGNGACRAWPPTPSFGPVPEVN